MKSIGDFVVEDKLENRNINLQAINIAKLRSRGLPKSLKKEVLEPKISH